MNEPTPLPCPFCGFQPALSFGRNDLARYVCPNTTCPSTVESGEPEEAIRMWNTRHTPEADTAPKVYAPSEQIAQKIAILKSKGWREHLGASQVFSHTRQSGSFGPCDLFHAWDIQTMWNDLDAHPVAPKVDEQLEKDIEWMKTACLPTPYDIIARTILHLLKR